MRKLFAFAAVVLVSSLGVASADSKAWSVAKDNMPGDTPLAIAVDVQALQKTATYSKFVPLLTGKQDVKDGFDLIKANCKIDALTAISSVAVGGDPNTDDAAIYLSIPGFDQKKVGTCLQAVAAAKNSKKKLTINTDGNISELTDGGDKVYVGFIGEVAVMVPKKMGDKAALKKWMGGGGAFAKGALGKLLGKANASAAVFGGTVDTKQLKGSGVDVKNAFGWLSVSGGNFNVELHGEFGDAKSATKMVDDANKQLTAVKGTKGVPATIANLLKGVTISASGAEAIVKATGKESDAADALQMLVMMSGGGGGSSTPTPGH